ncbi:MAG: NAD(P)H-dependent oxidoreductase subunit E [Cellulosilyticaceae bacterium]
MEIKVCVGSACYVKGSHQVIQKMGELIDKYQIKNQLELKAAFCLGNCTQAVSVEFDGKIYGIDKDEVEKFFLEVVYGRLKQ